MVRVLQQAITDSGGGLKEFGRVRIYALNPKSITMNQLYGATDMQTNEWTDGIASVIVRHCSNPNVDETKVTQGDTKWVYFDGPVDAIWIENMNTVLDDNKKLCLNSGEIIQLSDTMRIMFEVEDLRHASPATVSRCGMIWVEPPFLMPEEGAPCSACPLVTSFVEHLPAPIAPHAEAINGLFDEYVWILLDYTRRHVNEAVTTVDNNLLKSLFQLLNTFFLEFVPKEEQETKAFDPATLEPFFVFALVWSFGASATIAGRASFEKKMREMLADKPFAPPGEDSVFDYLYDVDTKKWAHWSKTVPEYVIPKGVGFADILVPTVDTIRTTFVMRQLLLKDFHVLVVGETGTSKTVVTQNTLINSMPDNYDPIIMGFSAQTSANMTQDILDGKFDKRRQGRDNNPDNKPACKTAELDSGLDYTMWGPPIGKRCVIFVDDFNMPMCETYDAQPPIELLRQMVDYKGWYDRKMYRIKRLVDIALVGAMGPPGGGRNPVTPRMLRHFNFVSMVDMADSSIAGIYVTILGDFLKKFEDEIAESAPQVVAATISAYNTLRAELLPTPAKSHYTFNLRDVAKTIQGVTACNYKTLKTLPQLANLWTHEASRVFQDRFVTEDDRVYFKELLSKLCKEHFGLDFKDCVKTDRLMYCDFLVPGADFDARTYEEAPGMVEVTQLMNEYLDDYNQTNVPMDLILFGDAICHIARITRVIRQPLGNMLLLGVGGSGRKSLAKLSTAIADFALFSIEITKNYRLIEWREDLKQLLLKAGKDGKKTVFLFDDTQIVMETFLEDINNILNSAEVPNLMKDEDLGPIFDLMTPILQAKNIMCTKLNLYGQFISRVRDNLHLVICMSPVGDDFRNRLRMFPSLVNCCTIDWFTAWPEEALVNVAEQQLKVDGVTEETFAGIIKMCGFIHLSVERCSVRYLEEMNRHNYVTPTSYLELLKSINALTVTKRGEVSTARMRLQNGLDKLNSTNQQVGELKQMLKDKAPVLEKTLKDVAAQQIVIDKEKSEAAVIQESAEKMSAAAAIKAKEAGAIKADAEADLAKALPALANAVKCLKELQKGDIVEVKSMGKPPAGVKLVLEGTCIMFGQKPVMEKNQESGKKEANWAKSAAPLLANPAKFLDMLIQFDKDAIAEKTIKAVTHLIENELFTPEVIAKVSKACTAICTWVHAMHTYYYISREVEPKRQRLEKAESELAIVNAQVADANAKLDTVTKKLAELSAAFEEAVGTKQRLETEVKQCSDKLERADKLIGGLGGEAVRWTETVKELVIAETNVIGDVLVSAGTISYLGPFMQAYRSVLEGEWQDKLTVLSVPHSRGVTMMSTLMDPVLVRQWNIQKLPSDDFSIANGIIMINSSRWPVQALLLLAAHTLNATGQSRVTLSLQ